jgi:hypothetical protein
MLPAELSHAFVPRWNLAPQSASPAWQQASICWQFVQENAKRLQSVYDRCFFASNVQIQGCFGGFSVQIQGCFGGFHDQIQGCFALMD